MEPERCCCVCGSLLWMAIDGADPPHVWCIEHWRGSWVRVTSYAGKQAVLRAQVVAP